MYEIFLTGNATWFTIPALVGTGVFLLRVLLMMLGGAGVDIHHDFDVHADTGDVHSDTGDALKLLSVQSITAFLMGFGWGGLGSLKGSGWNELTSVLVGLVCGAGMVWLVGILLRAAWGLQSSGNVPIDSTVGADGTVYVSIPEQGHGQGQVRVVVENRQRIYNAVSGGPALATQARVKVIGVNDDRTLTVAPM
jgi:hypothetical protein